MTRSTISDLTNIKDPLLPYNFDLVIPNVPGGGDGFQLQLRCESTQIPGMEIEGALVQLRGMELNFAGRQVYTHQLTVTYLEARDIKTRMSLLNWMYFARDFRNQEGNYKANYSVIADLLLYDDVGNITRTIRLFGVFPTRLEDANLESGSSTPVALSGTFSYDYFEDLQVVEP